MRPAQSRGNVACGLQQGQASPMTQHNHTNPSLGAKAGDTLKVTLKDRLAILQDTPTPDITQNTANPSCP